MSKIVRNKGSEVQLSLEEFDYLTQVAKDHSLTLATYLRHAALMHSRYVSEFRVRQNKEYLEYQMGGKPLHRVFKKEGEEHDGKTK